MSSINFYRLAQTHEEIQALLNKIEENYSITLEQYLDLLSTDSRLSELVTQKVHQIPGKGLSTEDFETRFKDVLIEILNQGGIKPIIHNTIDEDINSSEGQSLGALLSNKVDKIDGKGLSTEDFATVYLELLQEIRGHSNVEEPGRTARVFIENEIEASIENGLLHNEFENKSDATHLHDDKYVQLEEGKALSTNDFTNAHKEIVDEMLQESNAKDFVISTVIDDATDPNGLMCSLLDDKSDITHGHANYVERDYLITKADNGAFEIVEDNAGENQIVKTDSRIAELVNNNILSVGDKIDIQEKVLSDANVTLEEKAYLVQMTTNGEAMMDTLISNNIANGSLNVAMNLKVDKIQGYSLVPNSEIEKLANINLITDSDIDQAISDIFN